jgi:hypothetical protein
MNCFPRNRRSETTVQIRKEKKEDQINQRRKIISEAFGVSEQTAAFAFPNASLDNAVSALVSMDPSSSAAYNNKPPSTPVSIEKIAQYRQELFVSDISVVINATQQFRRLLSIGRTF